MWIVSILQAATRAEIIQYCTDKIFYNKQLIFYNITINKHFNEICSKLERFRSLLFNVTGDNIKKWK